MYAAYVTVTVVTISTNALAAVADYAGVRQVLANADQVGVPRSWVPTLGTLKLLGAVGLLLGLIGVPYVGIAAGFGLVLFFLGAIVAHVRTRAFRKIAIPGGMLVLAAATLALALAV